MLACNFPGLFSQLHYPSILLNIFSSANRPLLARQLLVTFVVRPKFLFYFLITMLQGKACLGVCVT